MTSSPSSICSMRWCANRCSSPTGHRGAPGSRCWRRSASSPRSNWRPRVRPHEVRDGARPLLRGARSRHHGAVGQPAAAGGLRRGSQPNWPTCALRFGGPPTTATSTPPPPSPRSPDSRFGVRTRITSRSTGPRSSSNLPVPSTIRGSSSLYVRRIAVLHGRTSRRGRRATPRPARRRRQPMVRRIPFGSSVWACGATCSIGQPERYVECVPQHLDQRPATPTALSRVSSGHRAGVREVAEEAISRRRRPRSKPPRPPAIRMRSHSRCSSTAWRSATPIPLARARRASPGSGDRPRQRQPLNESHTGDGPGRRSRSKLRRTAGRARLRHPRRSATTTTRAASPCSACALAMLAAFLDRLGRFESAAVIAGFAASVP